jgi:hypothetical protein
MRASDIGDFLHRCRLMEDAAEDKSNILNLILQLQTSKGKEYLVSILKAVKELLISEDDVVYISGPKGVEYGLTEEYLQEEGFKLHVDEWRMVVPDMPQEEEYLGFIHHEEKRGKMFVKNQLF